MKLLRFWEAAKDWLAAYLHVTHWTIHFCIGLLLLLLLGRLLRLPLRSAWPLVPIALLEALNEAADFTRYYVSHWPWTPESTLIEVALTLVPPTIVVAVARLVHQRGARAQAPS